MDFRGTLHDWKIWTPLTISIHILRVGCGKSRFHVCRGFLVFWVFVFWLTPITLTVLCVSACSDGLFDFHIPCVSSRSVQLLKRLGWKTSVSDEARLFAQVCSVSALKNLTCLGSATIC